MTKRMQTFQPGLPPELMARIRADAKRHDRPIAREIRHLMNPGYLFRDTLEAAK